MIRKQKAWLKATELRKRGFTYAEIAHYVGVSKGTVSSWFSHETWSKKVSDDNARRAARENSKRITLLNRARSNQNKRLYTEAERSATTEFKHYRHSPLFIAGLMVYMALGDQTAHGRMRISSARMEPHRVFIRFSREFLGVNPQNVHCWLILYPAHDEGACLHAWSRKIGLSATQFYKSQVVQGQNTKQALQYGVGNTVINNAVFKQKLLKWIDLLGREL